MDTCPAVMIAIAPGPAEVLCRLDALPDGGATAIELAAVPGGEPRSLIVLRRAATVQAFENVCPHAGRRLDYAPGKFLLNGDTLICAVHGATFQQADGLCIAGPCRGQQLREVPLRVIGDSVCLAVPGASGKPGSASGPRRPSQ
jgi:nitrite reductase/ring-hydroxylating ferredoxin subunit